MTPPKPSGSAAPAHPILLGNFSELDPKPSPSKVIPVSNHEEKDTLVRPYAALGGGIDISVDDSIGHNFFAEAGVSLNQLRFKVREFFGGRFSGVFRDDDWKKMGNLPFHDPQKVTILHDTIHHPVETDMELVAGLQFCLFSPLWLGLFASFGTGTGTQTLNREKSTNTYEIGPRQETKENFEYSYREWSMVGRGGLIVSAQLFSNDKFTMEFNSQISFGNRALLPPAWFDHGKSEKWGFDNNVGFAIGY